MNLANISARLREKKLESKNTKNLKYLINKLYPLNRGLVSKNNFKTLKILKSK